MMEKQKSVLSARPALHGPTRRIVLASAGTALAAPFIARLINPARAQSRTLNIASYGGTYAEALKKAWLDPFEKETGIKVNLGVNASLSLAKLQVMNPNGAEWDIVDLSGSEYPIALRENLLIPMDPKRVDTSNIAPEYVSSHAFCFALFSYVMGWDRRKISDADAPKTWAEFWDSKKYPFKKTLQSVKTNGNSLEVALLADGVTPDKLYPLDINRALESLNKLGKRNIVWAQTNQEPIQRVMSGETPLGGLYTGRAIIANRGGAQIGFSMNQAIVGGDWLGVIRNARNSAEAIELQNFIATKGERAAEFTAMTSYEVPHKDVARLLPKEADDIKASLPTNSDLKGKILIKNEDWWGQNLEGAATRFREWQLS